MPLRKASIRNRLANLKRNIAPVSISDDISLPSDTASVSSTSSYSIAPSPPPSGPPEPCSSEVDSSIYNPDEEGNGDDVDVQDEQGRINLWSRLRMGLKAFEEKLRIQARPVRYDKINPAPRTLRRKAHDTTKATENLRTAGFPNLARWFKPDGLASPKRKSQMAQQHDGTPEPRCRLKRRRVDAEGSIELETTQTNKNESGYHESDSEDEIFIDGDSLVSSESLSGRKFDGETRCNSEDASEAETGEAAANHPSVSEGGTKSAEPIPPSESGAPLNMPCPTAELGAEEEATEPKAQRRRPPERLSVPKFIKGLEKLTNKAGIDLVFRARITAMLGALRFYASGASWVEASLSAATAAGKGSWLAHEIRRWLFDYIDNEDDLPINRYGQGNVSRIEDEDLASDIRLHLLSKGPYFKAQDIVDFMAQDDTKMKYGLTNGICEKTAHRWFRTMEFQFGEPKKGMYVDGHERDDIVKYRQEVFIPLWVDLERRMELRDRDGNVTQTPNLAAGELRVILLTHDESTFFANDRRNTRWIHKDEKPTPVKKGEGVSIMVSDLCTPEAGWLRSADGSESSRVIFKAGKNRDGWFGYDDIRAQMENALNIFEDKFGPDIIAAVGFDNAPSHQKRAPDALSARYTPLRPKIWNGKSGTQMRDGKFKDGRPQPLYFPEDHESHPGQFKGMKIILEERELWPTDRKFLAECKGFKCEAGATDCCARRMLFNQPDFANQKPAIQEYVESRGHLAFFYPKYHCEVNFIEQVWGRAKWKYREFPPTSTEAEMEKNVIEALDSVEPQQFRRFSTRSARFIHAYRIGLNGSQAAWASRKYHGHRTIPLSILSELESIPE